MVLFLITKKCLIFSKMTDPHDGSLTSLQWLLNVNTSELLTKQTIQTNKKAQNTTRTTKKSSLNIRPFVCDTCAKMFKQKHHLIEHKRQHTGEKPFECVACGKRFNHSGNYSHHNKICRLHKEQQHSLETEATSTPVFDCNADSDDVLLFRHFSSSVWVGQ